MSRLKRGKISAKRRRNVLRQTKGFRWGGKSKERAARERLLHAGAHAFADRKKKKGDFRRLWNIKINAGVRPLGLSYSKFINLLAKKNIKLNRKILAYLAEHKPEAFAKVVEETKV